MIYYANDRYNATLTSGYTVGDTTLEVDRVPVNTPTIIVVNYGTASETIFEVADKSANTLTGVRRLRGANVNLPPGSSVTCLNNEEFINQVSSFAKFQVEHNTDGTHFKASGSDVNTGTDPNKIVTPKAIGDSFLFSLISVGTVTLFAGNTPPNGWLLCDGSAISRTTYAKLFAVIGTTYGAGDGSTTFNLPNLKGRVPVGLDTSQTEFNTLGKTGGAKTHTLTINEMPSHTHIQDAHRHWISSAQRDDGNGTGCMGNSQMYGLWADAGSYSSDDPGYAYGRNSQWTTATNQNTGGGQAHNNLQPYISLNFIIKY